jgi:hypothetical protein
MLDASTASIPSLVLQSPFSEPEDGYVGGRLLNLEVGMH